MLDRIGCSFHHVGVACRSLEQEMPAWSRLGYQPESSVFEDPLQSVRGQFWTGPGPRIELLESLSPTGPVAQMVKRGIKIYHQGFEVHSFDATIELMRTANLKVVRGPVPAVAFAGRRIAFLLMQNMNMIEIIEKEPN